MDEDDDIEQIKRMREVKGKGVNLLVVRTTEDLLSLLYYLNRGIDAI